MVREASGWILSAHHSISRSLSRAAWPIFIYPGVIKNVFRLIYTHLVEHDIIIGIHYDSRLLWVCSVLEQALVKRFKPMTVRGRWIFLCSERKGAALLFSWCHPFHHLQGCDPKHHHELHTAGSRVLTILQWQQCWGGAPGPELWILSVQKHLLCRPD